MESILTTLYISSLFVVLAHLILEASAFQIFVEALVGVNKVSVVHIFYFCHFYNLTFS